MHMDEAAPGSGGESRAIAPPSEEDGWDEAAVEAAVVERCGGSVTLAGRLLRAFVQQTGEDLASIESAAAARDAATMGRAAHRLKGAAASLGLESCREAATAILTLAHAGCTDGTAPHVSALGGHAARIARMRMARESVQG